MISSRNAFRVSHSSGWRKSWWRCSSPTILKSVLDLHNP